KSIRKKDGVKRSLTQVEDKNNNINNNATNSDKSGSKSDGSVAVDKGLLIENILGLPLQKTKSIVKLGHSRNSSSSSLTSNRSTNSVSLGFRSAPTTPMAPLQNQSNGHGQSAVNLNSLSRSPSHVSAKIDSKSIKHLSTVPPVTSSNTRSPSPHPTKTSTKNDIPEKETKRKEQSSGRQKKFHRHFQQVDAEERVINYFSCALVGDILLQGHLYITQNYFAFYSNVFGYVTKLLIPITSVVKISKEKTAKIIPNAVGVTTADERHVFGSFMSREAAYILMLSVWRPIAFVEPEVAAKIPDVEVSEYSIEDDSSSAVSGNESPPRLQESTTSDASQTLRLRSVPSLIEEKTNGLRTLVADVVEGASNSGFLSPNVNQFPMPSRSTSPPPKIVIPRKLLSFPLPTNLLYIGLVLTILLALLSGFLLYRIINIQAKSSHYDPLDFKWNPANKDIDVYTEVLKWQKEMQSKSVDEAQIVLNSNLEKIARVRKSLETLSVLIHNKDAPSLTDYSYISGNQDEPMEGTTFDRSKG
ncbi:Protein Aster-B, partial [Pseudolycoriella hygida]